MTEHHTNGDEVETVIQAYLDYLDGVGPKPTLDHLDDAGRRQATALIESLRAGRGMDPYASRPPIEALLAGTELESALATSEAWRLAADAAAVRDVLSNADPSARIEVERSRAGLETIVFRHLDLRVHFLLVDARTPAVSDTVRTILERQLSDDPDIEYFGVIASRDEELSTQLLSAADLGPTTTTPHGAAPASWMAVLPLPWAARRVVELGAPEWDSFNLDSSTPEPLDVKSVVAEIAHDVITREARRAYRGDKARAYKSLLGHEDTFADLVEHVAIRGAANVDLEAETLRIAREAA
jgi:hypothetical protein